MNFDRETVATYLQLHEATLARLRLQAAGIDAELADTGIVGANPFLANAVGGVKLQVPKEAAERARAVLREPGSAPAGEAAACMSCGKPMAESDNACAACGWTWNEAAE